MDRRRFDEIGEEPPFLTEVTAFVFILFCFLLLIWEFL